MVSVASNDGGLEREVWPTGHVSGQARTELSRGCPGCPVMSGHARSCPVACPVVSGSMSGSTSEIVSVSVR